MDMTLSYKIENINNIKNLEYIYFEVITVIFCVKALCIEKCCNKFTINQAVSQDIREIVLVLRYQFVIDCNKDYTKYSC
jgi:hypothetical protein